MLTRIGNAARRWSGSIEPWTNVYGVGRTLLALGTLGTLLFSHSTVFFRPAAGVESAPYCTDALQNLALFCLCPRVQLELARWIAIVILAVAASGWRPRITGVLHWWIAFSLQATASAIDGGDQITAVLTLLLIPVTLTDARKWHWQKPLERNAECQKLIALATLLIIRLQVAGVYFHAAMGKFVVTEWKDGTALYYWLLDPFFGAPGWLRPILTPILSNGIAVSLLTWGTLVLEIALFMALVMPKRYWGPLLVAGIAFHAGIAVMQGLISFGLAMSAALVLYLRPIERPFGLPKLSAPAEEEPAGTYATT